MKKWTFILLVLPKYVLLGQNLIPNAGFDQLTNCPFDDGQISFAAPWGAASGTPDLFNMCSNISFIMVPFAGTWIDSYQMSKSGSGFAGIEVYTNVNLTDGNSEYMETPLKSPLQKGKTYYLEFYVSPDVTPISYWGFTDAIGLALSDTFYYKNLGPMEALPLKTVIENRGTEIRDTAGWTKISGCYTAKGGEKFAIIGNFRTTQETLVEFVNPTYPFNSYFYIEDVLIQAFDPLPDTLLLCDGASKTLNAGFLDAAYRWNTGSTDSTITIQSPGTYTIEASMDKCALRDTVIVLDLREEGGFPKDTAICREEPLTLTSPITGQYLWSDGSTNRTNIIRTTGSYELTVTNECGQFVFSTEVEAKDCGCNIYIPNAISPNGDGVNDELQVFIGCDFQYQIKRLSVFDRWGSNIYTTTESTEIKWDGKHKGKAVPNGVYAWFLEYEVVRNGTVQKLTESGDVSVLK